MHLTKSDFKKHKILKKNSQNQSQSYIFGAFMCINGYVKVFWSEMLFIVRKLGIGAGHESTSRIMTSTTVLTFSLPRWLIRLRWLDAIHLHAGNVSKKKKKKAMYLKNGKLQWLCNKRTRSERVLSFLSWPVIFICTLILLIFISWVIYLFSFKIQYLYKHIPKINQCV